MRQSGKLLGIVAAVAAASFLPLSISLPDGGGHGSLGRSFEILGVNNACGQAEECEDDHPDYICSSDSTDIPDAICVKGCGVLPGG